MIESIADQTNLLALNAEKRPGRKLVEVLQWWRMRLKIGGNNSHLRDQIGHR